eukprot:10278518-Ditylum_brightwellii.AAC.1
MAGTTKEKVQQDNKFYKKYNTTAELAKFDVQVRMANPTGSYNNNKVQMIALAIFAQGPYAKISSKLMEDVVEMIRNKNEIKFVLLSLKYDQTIKDNKNHYSNLLHKQNAYLVNYVDVCVRGLTEEVLSVEISGKTDWENILEPPHVVGMHKTAYTNNKGIWTTKTTKDTLHQAMSEIDKGLE